MLALMSAQKAFKKPKFTPSNLGIFELSHSHNYLRSSSFENSRTRLSFVLR